MSGNPCLNLAPCPMSEDVRQIHNLQQGYERARDMHIEFRHLRTIQAIHEAGGLARAAELHEHHPVGAEPSGQGAGGSGRGRAVRAPLQAVEAVGGGAAAVAAGRKGVARDRGAGGRFPQPAIGQVGAAAHRHRMPRLFRMAVPGAGRSSARPGRMSMSISAPGWRSTRCPRCSAKRSIWWCRRTPRIWTASTSRRCSTTSRCSSRQSQHPLAQKAIRRGRGFPRRDADHLSGGPGAAGCVQPAADARQGRTARHPAGGTDGGDPAAGRVQSRRRGAARLGGARGASIIRIT